jgi:hypothetical protein
MCQENEMGPLGFCIMIGWEISQLYLQIDESRFRQREERRMKYSIGLIRSAPKKPPIFLRFRSSEALIISTVALAIFTDIFLYGVYLRSILR